MQHRGYSYCTKPEVDTCCSEAHILNAYMPIWAQDCIQCACKRNLGFFPSNFWALLGYTILHLRSCRYEQLYPATLRNNMRLLLTPQHHGGHRHHHLLKGNTGPWQHRKIVHGSAPSPTWRTTSSTSTMSPPGQVWPFQRTDGETGKQETST